MSSPQQPLGPLTPQTMIYTFHKHELFYRFGHSMVSKEVFARDSNFIDRTQLSLNETFFRPEAVENDRNFVEKTTRGQIVESAQGWDPGFNDDIRNKLFDENLDLISLNIQRGREHGIPGK